MCVCLCVCVCVCVTLVAACKKKTMGVCVSFWVCVFCRDHFHEFGMAVPSVGASASDLLCMVSECVFVCVSLCEAHCVCF